MEELKALTKVFSILEDLKRDVQETAEFTETLVKRFSPEAGMQDVPTEEGSPQSDCEENLETGEGKLDRVEQQVEDAANPGNKGCVLKDPGAGNHNVPTEKASTQNVCQEHLEAAKERPGGSKQKVESAENPEARVLLHAERDEQGQNAADFVGYSDWLSGLISEIENSMIFSASTTQQILKSYSKHNYDTIKLKRNIEGLVMSVKYASKKAAQEKQFKHVIEKKKDVELCCHSKEFK